MHCNTVGKEVTSGKENYCKISNIGFKRRKEN